MTARYLRSLIMRRPVLQINLSALWAVLVSAAIAATAWSQSSTTPVDVNTADVKTLETLPGIGSTLANRIVEGRPYKSIDDLAKVKGLSQSKVDAMKDKITVGPSAST